MEPMGLPVSALPLAEGGPSPLHSRLASQRQLVGEGRGGRLSL